MKFMKLGSKPDTFQTEENNIRYAASELATDVVILVGDVKFYLHKFPLLSKSARLQKLVISSTSNDEITLDEIPGGPTAFETCAKFCYGMTVTLNAHNVVPARCAAEYLEMHETVEKGNLVHKLDIFLASSIFRGWKDSIIALRSAQSLAPFSEELKIVSRCVDSVSSMASADVSKVNWSYTYNRKKATEENGNGLRTRAVPLDWWAEDLGELDMDSYRRVIVSVKQKGLVPVEAIGEALKAYAYLKLPATGKNSVVPREDLPGICSVLENVVWLLPAEKGCVSCGFLLKLLKAAVSANSDERVKSELVRRVGQQLEEASVNDLLIPSCEGGESIMYDVEIVRKILEEFVAKDGSFEMEMENGGEIREMGRSGILSEASKLMVAKLVDGYLAEISKDPNLPLSSFIGISELVSGFSRPAHDGLYRAIDTYLKEHPGISKSERKRICRLMDCKKLSAETCMHAVQNERLPLRVVVQVLFFEHARAAASSGASTPDLPKAIKDLTCNNSLGSSRSATTNTDEDWDALASADELRALRGELAALRLGNGGPNEEVVRAGGPARGAIGKVKGLIASRRVFSRIWSGKGGSGENSGSDSSESLGSGHNNNNNNNQNSHDEGRSTASRRGRHSVS